MNKKCTKAKYTSEEYALLDIELMKKRGSHSYPVSAYLCGKCNLWHLTSIPSYNNKDVYNLKRQIEELTKIVERQKKTIEEQTVKISATKKINTDWTTERRLYEQRINKRDAVIRGLEAQVMLVKDIHAQDIVSFEAENKKLKEKIKELEDEARQNIQTIYENE